LKNAVLGPKEKLIPQYQKSYATVPLKAESRGLLWAGVRFCPGWREAEQLHPLGPGHGHQEGRPPSSLTVFTESLFKETVSRDGYFFKGLNKTINNCWWFPMSFKSFSLPYCIQLLTFYLLIWNYLKILKPSSEFSSLWLADLSLAAGKMHKY
jgi:hypothetical protein